MTKFGEMGTLLHASGADLAGYQPFARQWQGRGHDLSMANGNAWVVEDIHRLTLDGTIQYEQAGLWKTAQIDIATIKLGSMVQNLDRTYGGRTFQGDLLPDLTFDAVGPQGESVRFVIEHKWSGGTVSYGTREGKQFQKYAANRDRLVADEGVDFVITQYRVYGNVDLALRTDIGRLIEKGFQLLLFGGV